ncbi:MAG: diadenylate cyclase CdaA [Bacilli bacterium]|nr:diadenylate cyclase CdaA [Bacilli bacterium]MDD4298237.1 diadenylate cyclase CdaA [Bacilli bacterium]MDD4643734.1 diadenylate cyclase CdaA [Bacilli bacterium]
MTLDFIISTIMKIIDVALVWFFLYYILKNIRNNVKMSLLFKGIIFIVLIKVLSDWLGLVTIGLLLEYVIMWGPLALIIIFQPEIRNVLEQIGKTQLLGRHKVLSVGEREKIVREITLAVEYLKKTRIGALIVIERDVSLRDYIERSKKIYADITSELLISIFFPNNPLHDGGVIIQGDRISCAGAVFPTSVDMKIVKRLGTRHRAALGISEETDCISIIVSEETGRISIATNGELNYNLTLDDFSEILLEELRPKNDVVVEEEVEEAENENEE